MGQRNFLLISIRPTSLALYPFGNVLIVMLGGGDKAMQTADIAKAIKLVA